MPRTSTIDRPKSIILADRNIAQHSKHPAADLNALSLPFIGGRYHPLWLSFTAVVCTSPSHLKCSLIYRQVLAEICSCCVLFVHLELLCGCVWKNRREGVGRRLFVAGTIPRMNSHGFILFVDRRHDEVITAHEGFPDLPHY